MFFLRFLSVLKGFFRGSYPFLLGVPIPLVGGVLSFLLGVPILFRGSHIVCVYKICLAISLSSHESQFAPRRDLYFSIICLASSPLSQESQFAPKCDLYFSIIRAGCCRYVEGILNPLPSGKVFNNNFHILQGYLKATSL